MGQSESSASLAWGSVVVQGKLDQLLWNLVEAPEAFSHHLLPSRAPGEAPHEAWGPCSAVGPGLPGIGVDWPPWLFAV